MQNWTRTRHQAVITRSERQLRGDDLPGWERDELLDTIAMHTAALANASS